MPIFDQILRPISVVDLRPLGSVDVPLSARRAVFSASGDRVFITLGTGAFRLGALLAEKIRVVVASIGTGAIERVVEIDDYGGEYNSVLIR